MRNAFITTFMLAIGLVSTSAHAYPDLCTSVSSQCEFTGPDAPVLAANVCWSRTTGTTTLMTSSICPNGSYPFFVKYGLVSVTGIVTGLMPLPDACDRPGLCTPSEFAPPSGTTSAAMCCLDGVCWPAVAINTCEGGEILFCSEGVTNEDGTVECFDNEPA